MKSKSPQYKLWTTLICLILPNVLQCEDLPCAEVCACYIYRNAFKADCSGNGLYDIPDGLSEEIEILDLSDNNFEEIPQSINKFASLTQLDFGGNRIHTLRASALEKLTYLETLILSNNNFTKWINLNPNDVLRPARNLLSLDLSQNPLNAFGNLANREILISDSLELLNLKNCGIPSIHGRSPIGSLTNLRTLIISNNPLRRIQKLTSPNLSQLDLSHCELNYIHHDELSFLPSLTALNLSNNYRLIISTKLGSLSSTSLKFIDISMCNVDQPGLSGFQNLKEANLRGNMIRRLSANLFANNSLLEMLDLSSNVIDTIDSTAFQGLSSLRWMNLSVNVIPNIPEDAFLKTPNLTTLLLSRNYLTSVGVINSPSIKKLDMSLCEIQFLFPGSFSGKNSLTEINLSRNLIAKIPDDIDSATLQNLDLSYNRLSNVNNHTFQRLPKLTTISLTGNRFTTMWLPEYFASNPNLQEIHLSDNTWRCDCHDDLMKDFFLFLTEEPSKVWNVNTLICHSPSNYSGMNWQEACYYIWNPPSMAQNDRVLMFMMVLFVGFTVCVFIVIIIRRYLNARLKAINDERERQLEEARERLRLLRMQSQQEDAQINAPDPRDLISPPSYAEALLLPRLDGSYFSLADVDGAPRKKRHRRKGRRRTKSNGDILNSTNDTTDDEPPADDNAGSIQEIQTLDRSPITRRRAPSLDTSSVTIEVIQVEITPAHLRRNSTRNSVVPESDL